MTTDQLERDLTSLAEPHADDDRLRLSIRATLREQVRPAPRRRTRLAFGFGAIAAATVAAAIVALIGTGGSSDAAILAHVVHASSPPANLVVHLKETGTQPDGTQVSAEWWQETNAPYAMRLIKGVSGQSNETMRAGLTDGTAHVAGTVTIGGRSLYKIELPNGVVGYFDKTSYRPVYIDNPQRDGSIVRTEVTAYDELPLNAQNEKLVSITEQHPGARVQQGEAPGPTKQR